MKKTLKNNEKCKKFVKFCQNQVILTKSASFRQYHAILGKENSISK
jgi:hypothetical protein